MKTRATARVTVKLEVNLSQPWTKEATIEQIQEQAESEAKNIVSQHFAKLSCIKMLQKANVDVIIVKEK